MKRISLLSFRDTLSHPMGLDRGAIMILTDHNITQFIERLRGQSTVLVISHPAGAEAVEVYSPDGQRLVAITRGIDDSPIMMHPAGACVEFHSLPIDGQTFVDAICSSPEATVAMRRCLEDSSPE